MNSVTELETPCDSNRAFDSQWRPLAKLDMEVAAAVGASFSGNLKLRIEGGRFLLSLKGFVGLGGWLQRLYRPLAQPAVASSTPVLPAQVAPGAACQRRILMNTIDGKLIALDADNGKFCPDFGTNGSVNLHEGMGDASDPPTC